MDELWIGTTEAARRLGVGAATLRRFIHAGALPAYRLGRVIRIRVVDLEAFIESSRVEPGSLGTHASRAEGGSPVTDRRRSHPVQR